ncbi:hypothetical protein M436DRAFT_83873 [Aureobasidium namibiae CBS 147.97]|uniref:TPR-like protein n=1 Tax=Aureobasidium namibiae CBS 147.97 TaxID=1043004 RepID=A0A074X8D6_9PEZI
MSSLLAASTRAPRRILATELCLGSTQIRMRSRIAPRLRDKYYRGRRVLTPETLAAEEKFEQSMTSAGQELKTEFDELLRRKGKATLPERMGLVQREEEMALVEKMGLAETTAAAASELSTKQALFICLWLGQYAKNHGSPPSPEALRLIFGALDPLSLDDVYDSTFILRNKGTVQCAKTGRRLINQCAELGHAEAAIQVVASALRQDAIKPGVLRNPTVMKATERVHEGAKTGNVRALVMEANLARHMGQVGRATAQYQKAVDRIMKDGGVQEGDKYSLIKDELSSPWIELGYLRTTQGQMVDAMKAYLAGQESDDPMAFFNLARLDLFMAGTHSHDWLYNMTKAAASGHYLAAQELGEYYANSAANSPKPQESLLVKLSGFVEFLRKPYLDLNPKTNIHHHDAFANTPQLRIKLAHEWLSTARHNYYLFANISLAQLYLQKFMYPQGTLKKPLDPYGHSTDSGAIVNPLFDPAKAQVMLTEVLTACRRIAEAKSVSTTNAEYRHNARPWSHHPEVLEAVESTETLQELEEQAEMIADAAGIDIYSSTALAPEIPHLGFIRAHKGTRGEGLAELPKDDEPERANQEAVK